MRNEELIAATAFIRSGDYQSPFEGTGNRDIERPEKCPVDIFQWFERPENSPVESFQ